METRMPVGSLNVVNAAQMPSDGEYSHEEHDLEIDRPDSKPGQSTFERPAPALDVAYLTAQTLGDLELEIELLELFVAQARRLVPRLPIEDVIARADAAHLLKGSARAVGAQMLAAAVETYDQAGETQQGTEKAAYQIVVTALEQTEAAITLRLAELQA